MGPPREQMLGQQLGFQEPIFLLGSQTAGLQETQELAQLGASFHFLHPIQ